MDSYFSRELHQTEEEIQHHILLKLIYLSIQTCTNSISLKKFFNLFLLQAK